MVFGLLESNATATTAGKKFFAADHQVKGQKFFKFEQFGTNRVKNYEKRAEMAGLSRITEIRFA